MAKIYIASSWRNELQQAVVRMLRVRGHEVYDFRNPSPEHKGFSYSEVDPNWQNWSAQEFIQSFDHPRAIEAYNLDMGGIMWADVCILLMPCGRSAHIEAGYMKGLGKKVFVVLDDKHEAELMYKVFDEVFPDVTEMMLYMTFNKEVNNG